MTNVPLTYLRSARGLFPSNAVSVSDVDGDGRDDVVFAWTGGFDQSIGAQPVSWLTASGGGVADHPGQTFAMAHGTAVAVADVDGDGRSDVLFTDVGQQRGTAAGDGGFITYDAAGGAIAPAASGQLSGVRGFWFQTAVADFDRDGDVDVISAPYDSNLTGHTGWNLVGFRNLGRGSFAVDPALAPRQSFSLRDGQYTQPTSAVAAGDFTGDGYPDIVVGFPANAVYTGAALAPRIYVGGPAGFADAPSLALPLPDFARLGYGPNEFAAEKLVVGDINGDGLEDILAYFRVYHGNAGLSFNRVGQILLQTAPGQFADATGSIIGTDLWTIDGSATSPAAGQLTLIDVNNDGRLDVAANLANVGSANLARTVWIQGADGRMRTAASLGLDYSVQSPQFYGGSVPLNLQFSQFADVDGDGATDLFFTFQNPTPSGGADYYAGYLPGTLAGPVVRRGGFRDDAINGGSGNDVLAGGEGHDTLRGNGGDDAIDGGPGFDLAIFSGARAASTVVQAGAGHLVTGPDGRDVVANVERLQFADGLVALDVAGTAGQVYRLYQATFDRTPDGPGLSHNVGLVDRALSLRQMAEAFAVSPEFQAKYGAQVGDAAYVTALYANVLNRGPDSVGLNDWLGRLAAGQSRADVLIGFSESPENHGRVDPTIANGIALDYGVFG